MTDRVSSDHDSVSSHRVHLTQVGRTRRRQIELPDELTCAVDDVVWCSLEGTPAHAQVVSTLGGPNAIQHAFANQQLARTRTEGTDRFDEYLDAQDLAVGDPLVLDVLREGFAYGLRRPGQRVVYEPPEPPDETLADIARNLDPE